MKSKFIAFVLIVAFAIMAAGCKQPHINNVPEQNQEIEQFIHTASITLNALSQQKTAILESAVMAKINGKITREELSKVVVPCISFDHAFSHAGSILLDLRKNVDSGLSPSTASVESALDGLKKILLELEK